MDCKLPVTCRSYLMRRCTNFENQKLRAMHVYYIVSLAIVTEVPHLPAPWIFPRLPRAPRGVPRERGP